MEEYIELIKAHLLLEGQIKDDKIKAELFLKLINGEDIGAAAAALALTEIQYKMYTPARDGSRKFEFTINYTDNGAAKKQLIIKTIPGPLYKKIKRNDGLEYNLIFLYSILKFDTGQFWGIEPKIYKFIAQQFPRVIECFASPFNHNLADYYSVLYPIDRHYGSKGDFFKEFMTADYDAFVINPPFVETIIARVQGLIAEKLRTRPRTTIIYYIPAWDDLILPWYNALKIEAKHICLLDKNKSYVFDYINNRRFLAKFPTYFIYLANFNDSRNIAGQICGRAVKFI